MTHFITNISNIIYKHVNIYVVMNNNIILVNRFFFVFFLLNKMYRFLKEFFILNTFYKYCFLKFDLLLLLFKKIYFNLILKLHFLSTGFLYFKFLLKIGLGFRKKSIRRKNAFNIYIGGRHWVISFLNFKDFYFNIRRKNLLIFTQTKSSIDYYKCVIRCFRPEVVFKTKGVFLKRIRIRKRIPRSIIFARRVKFAKFKLKLSKKQKLI